MTTFESDQGGQGGPWNLSKKLRFWVFWPLEASGGVLNHIERLGKVLGWCILIVGCVWLKKLKKIFWVFFEWRHMYEILDGEGVGTVRRIFPGMRCGTPAPYMIEWFFWKPFSQIHVGWLRKRVFADITFTFGSTFTFVVKKSLFWTFRLLGETERSKNKSRGHGTSNLI